MMLAAQQRDEPVEALELKMLNDGLGFINVRFAAYCCGGLKGTTQHLGNHSKELLRRRPDVAEPSRQQETARGPGLP